MTSRPLPPVWQHSLLKLAALLLLATLVGLQLGNVWLMLTLVLASATAWQLINLYRLHRWLSSNRRLSPPAGWGVWSDVFQALYRRQMESRDRKRRLLDIVGEFRAATEALPDGVVLLDGALRIAWFNPGACELLGLRRGQDLKRPITHLLRDPAFRQWLEVAEQDPDGLVMDAPGQIDRRLRLRLFSYADSQHLLVARDVTQMQRVETMRKDFVANVSHELRTPLTVISGYLETMADEVGAEWSPVVARMEQQAGRMRAIVEDLLTLSRLDATQRLDEDVVVKIEPLLRDLAAEAELLSQGRHRVAWHCEADHDLHGSPKDLRSAFLNLVANAVRYTQEGGHIDIGWKSAGGEGIFSVRDDGPGIAAQHLPRLTERFYRICRDRSRASGGTGLGLAIVKNVLALHQARLEISSELGEGSEFRGVFPAERMVAKQPELRRPGM